jgi:transcription termination factor NusB
VAAETLKTLATQAKIVTITQLANAGINAAGTVEKNKILEEAEEHLQAAKDAEAEAKAFEAVVKMLQKVISQMQEELESMIDAALQSLDAVFGIIDDTQTSQKKIMQSSGA